MPDDTQFIFLCVIRHLNYTYLDGVALSILTPRGIEPFLHSLPTYISPHRARAALPDTRSDLHFFDEGVIPIPQMVTITG